jgi:hypothetical protein
VGKEKTIKAVAISQKMCDYKGPTADELYKQGRAVSSDARYLNRQCDEEQEEYESEEESEEEEETL